MLFNVDFFVVARASGAGFVVAVLWFGILDQWWRRLQDRPASAWAFQLSFRLAASAVSSCVTAFMLHHLLLGYLGAEDPRSGALVAGLIWVGFTAPFLVLSWVSSGSSPRRLATDGFGALLVIAAIGWVTGLAGGPYR